MTFWLNESQSLENVKNVFSKCNQTLQSVSTAAGWSINSEAADLFSECGGLQQDSEPVIGQTIF